MDNDKLYTPLVSIIIITYNSAKYVLETLESAKLQTYKNIELIISDDCSTDNTVKLCDTWLKDNKSRFTKTKLITVEKNLGIPKNCNRALYAAEGDWTKFIAGDDILMPNCVKDNIEFVQSNSEIIFCFSDYATYRDTFIDASLILANPETNRRSLMFTKLSVEFQLQVIARGATIHGGATFYHTESILALGGYDETFTHLEDWPTWNKLLKKDIKFHYLSIKTIKYRMHSEAITKKINTGQSFSLTAIKMGTVIKKFFLINYTVKEQILFYIEDSYFKFYKNRTVNNIISKVVRRIWYSFVNISIYERRKYLPKIYNKYIKPVE